jgi:hypothetical protein
MKSIASQIGRFALAAIAGVAFAGSAMAGSFTSSYSSGLSTYSIKGKEPDTTTKHPVFIYTVGTTEQWDNAQAMAAVDEMVAKGFVAAAVDYSNGLFGTCSQILAKAKDIYNPSSTSSAVSKLCSRARADCSKGIVVAGFSQGSVIAVTARNFDSRVRAAYGMGAHNNYSIYSLTSCMNASSYTLAKDKVRIVNGESDSFPLSVRSAAESVTGKSCGSTAFECLNANGSGWIMIRDSAVGDLQADHCYQRVGGCTGLQSTTDNTWRSGTASWSLKTNLNWLAQFATP